MLEAQQQWTVEYLISLTPEERAANRAEQDTVAEPVRERMPEMFVAEWDEIAEVNAALDEAFDAVEPPDDTLEQLYAEVQALGFSEITEYVMRDGLEVDGETWTFDRWVAAGTEQAAQLDAYCAAPS